MKRALLFLFLLCAFLLWTFPHRLVVERLLGPGLARHGVELSLGRVTPALPFGYRLRGLRLRYGSSRLTLDNVYLGLSLNGSIGVEAEACGGNIRGMLERAKGADSQARFELSFRDLDPSHCLELEGLTLGGSFYGALQLSGFDKPGTSTLLGSLAHSGRIKVEGRSGTVAGQLSAPRQASGSAKRERRPLGRWNFSLARLEASTNGRDVKVTEASARAEDVAWRLDKVHLTKSHGSALRLSAELTARPAERTPRSKAVLGLLPKAGEHPDGSRRYRITGPLDELRITGLR